MPEGITGASRGIHPRRTNPGKAAWRKGACNAPLRTLSRGHYLSQMSKGTPYVISAPSGGGKSSLIAKLLQRFPNLVYSISATTRTPRGEEQDGIHYYFKTPEEFRSMIENGELAEWNEVHGNFYGTPRGPVDAILGFGGSVILDLDVFGKPNFDKVYPDAVGILIVPPSLEELERRLRGRGTDPEDVIQTRLKNAIEELEFAKRHGKYEHTVVNDDFDRALDELIKILGK
jgi:guanylate kinase